MLNLIRGQNSIALQGRTEHHNSEDIAETQFWERLAADRRRDGKVNNNSTTTHTTNSNNFTCTAHIHQSPHKAKMNIYTDDKKNKFDDSTIKVLLSLMIQQLLIQNRIKLMR